MHKKSTGVDLLLKTNQTTKTTDSEGGYKYFQLKLEFDKLIT